jgi:hypothetical protein
MILIFFAISIPNIADLVLSILSYQEECKTYYIIRFVSQGINLLFIVVLFFLIIFLYIGDNYNPIASGIISLISCLYCVIAFLPMEITSLVFFIRNYDLLFYFGKIGFYIHASLIGLIILSFISGIIYIKCNPYVPLK